MGRRAHRLSPAGDCPGLKRVWDRRGGTACDFRLHSPDSVYGAQIGFCLPYEGGEPRDYIWYATFCSYWGTIFDSAVNF